MGHLKDNRTIKRYSESFKQKVLQELSSGRLTKQEIFGKYSIGQGTLYNWIKKYSRLDLLNPRIRIEMPEEQNEKQKLQARIKALETALVNTQLDHLKSAADLEVAMEMLGYDEQTRTEFEKKLEALRSKKR